MLYILSLEGHFLMGVIAHVLPHRAVSTPKLVSTHGADDAVTVFGALTLTVLARLHAYSPNPF